MTWTNTNRRWLWRAWTAERERIADCGWLLAETRDHAIANAQSLLGGPHRHEVVEIEVDEIPANESAPPATPPATSPASGADIERDGADVVPQTSAPSRSDLLTELLAMSKHAQRAHAIARELGDGALIALLSRIGWHGADAIARVGRAVERFNRRAS